MSDSKNFQRIRSLIEARKIYSRLPAEGTEIYCKGEGALFVLKSEKFDYNFGLHGLCVGLEDGPIRSEHVVVNFLLGRDRYYTVSDFASDGDYGWLRFGENLYKLERRAFIRLPIPQKWTHACSLVFYRDKPRFIDMNIVDISQGGAKLKVPSESVPDLREGESLRVIVQVRNKWKFEIEGVVLHPQKQDDHLIFGFGFHVTEERLRRRLTEMMLEIQREIWRLEKGW